MYVNGNEMAWVQHMRNLDVDLSQMFIFGGGSRLHIFTTAPVATVLEEKGTAGFPALSNIKGAQRSKEEIKTVIQSGGGRMPGFCIP